MMTCGCLSLVHYGASSHTTVTIKDFLPRNHVKEFCWVTNPHINHFWLEFDWRIRRLPVAPQNLQELQQFIFRARSVIEQGYIRFYIRTRLRRCSEITRWNGGYTRFWNSVTFNLEGQVVKECVLWWANMFCYWKINFVVGKWIVFLIMQFIFACFHYQQKYTIIVMGSS